MKGAPNFAKAFMDVLKNAINGIQREVISKVFYILLKKYCSWKLRCLFAFVPFCPLAPSASNLAAERLHVHTHRIVTQLDFCCFLHLPVQHLLEHLSWQRLQGNRVSKVGLGKRECARLEITFPEFFAVWKVPKSSNRGNDKFGNFATFNFPFARLQRLQRLLPNFEENNLNNSFLIYWLLQPLS